MEKTITFIGLDVHKKSLSVAVADGGVGGEVRFAGTISNTAGALTKLADRLARKGGVLSFCYEAGPCGYGVYRHLPGTDGACGSGFGKKARIEPPCVSHGIAPISPSSRPASGRRVPAGFDERPNLPKPKACAPQSPCLQVPAILSQGPRALPIPRFANRGAAALPYIWAENPGNGFGGVSVAKYTKISKARLQAATEIRGKRPAPENKHSLAEVPNGKTPSWTALRPLGV